MSNGEMLQNTGHNKLDIEFHEMFDSICKSFTYIIMQWVLLYYLISIICETLKALEPKSEKKKFRTRDRNSLSPSLLPLWFFILLQVLKYF